MVHPLPEIYFLKAIAAHPYWALFAAVLYVWCALLVWQLEMPKWVVLFVLASLVLVFTVIGLAAAGTSGTIVIG